MDIFRRMFGLPRREEQSPFTPRNEMPPAGLFIPEEQFDEEGDRHGLHSQIDQEFEEMERQFRDLWGMFGMGPDIFNQGFKSLFEGFGGMSEHPAISAGENVPTLPAVEHDDADLRRQMLKPSLAPCPRSDTKREDQDLDSSVQEKGLAALLEAKDAHIEQPSSPGPHFKSFSRSVSIQTYRTPDGTMETRRVVRDSEGNEEVTITQHPSDSPSQHPPLPPIPGRVPSFPGFFQPPHDDQRGLDVFAKIFGPRL